MSIKVKDILHLKPFQDAVIVAGGSGLDRKINGVSLIEVPESKDWFEENELYITAFYSIKNNIELQKATFEKIKNCNASGIVYIDLYLYNLDKIIITYANENNIPVIRVPNAVSYSSMISSIMRKIVQKKDEEILNSKKLKNKILQLFKENSKQNIIDLLDNLSGNPIFYISNNEKIYSKRCNKIPAEILNNLEKEINGFRENNIIENYKYSIYEVDTYNSHAKLVILYRSKTDTINLLRTTDFIMELGQLIITFQEYNDILIKTKEKQLKKEFFINLMKEDITENDIKNKLRKINWDIKRNFVSIIITTNNFKLSNDKIYCLSNKIQNIFNDNALLVREENKLIVLLSINKPVSEIKNLINKEFNDIKKFTIKSFLSKKREDGELIVTIGSLTDKLIKMKNSYSHAENVLNLCIKFNLSNIVCSWDDISIYYILINDNNYNNVKSFIDNILGNLLKNEYKIYLDTLYIYLCSNENRQKTAELMNIHYNTVNYRICKVSELLKGQLENNKYLVHLALTLSKIID